MSDDSVSISVAIKHLENQNRDSTLDRLFQVG